MKKTLFISVSLFISLFTPYGCALLKKDVEQFSHKAHIEKGLTCKGCHVTAVKADRAGMPDEGKCILCHPDLYEEKRIEKIYTISRWQATRGVRLAGFNDVKFSHKAHIDYGTRCSDCHKDIAESERVASEHIPNANICVQCHSQWLNQSLCSKCHIKTRLETQPEDHKRPDFILIHGERFRGKPFDNWIEGSARHSHLCFQCHNQDYCIKCHGEMEPLDHTNQWRLIGHGVSAGINRDNCKACHRVDFCFRCHEKTRPRSHAANWGATRSMHCAYCHEPLSSTNCAVCHKDTPTHREAPNAPLFVRKDWPCRLCHPLLVPLDHFDNGEDCENCHKTTRPSAKTVRRIRRIIDRIRE